MKRRHTERSLSSHGSSDRPTCSALRACSHPPSSLLTLTTPWPTPNKQSCPAGHLLSLLVVWYDQALCPFLSHASGSSSPSVWNFLPPNAARLIRHSVNILAALACEPRPGVCTALLTERQQKKFRLPAFTQWLYCSVISPVSKSSQRLAESDSGCADDCKRNEIMNHLGTTSTTTWEIFICRTTVSILVNAASLSESCVCLFLNIIYNSILWNKWIPVIKTHYVCHLLQGGLMNMFFSTFI